VTLTRVLFSSFLQLQLSLNHTLRLKERREGGKGIQEAAGNQERGSPKGHQQPCSSLRGAASAQGLCSQGGLRAKALSKASWQSQIPTGSQSSPKTYGAFLSTKQLLSSSWSLNLNPMLLGRAYLGQGIPGWFYTQGLGLVENVSPGNPWPSVPQSTAFSDICGA